MGVELDLSKYSTQFDKKSPPNPAVYSIPNKKKACKYNVLQACVL